MTARASLFISFIGIALAAGTAVGAQPAGKQSEPPPSSAMQGMQLNRDQPVKIEANTLEVRDKQRQATFSGSVKLVQGDMTLMCDALVIFYEDNAPAAPAQTAQKKGAPAQKAAQAPAPAQASGPGVGGNQQIKRAEAKGNVLVTQKDQTAKGDNAIFDTKANNITLTGAVVVTQGTNVLRGNRMVVNLTTGVANVESGATPTGERQRVEGLFNPSAAPPIAPAAPPPAPAPPPVAAKGPAAAPAKQSPAAKSQPGAPTRIN